MILACSTAQTFVALSGGPTPAPFDFCVVGLNYRTAPIGVRERAAVRENEQAALLAHLATHAREVMLLATCNRTEVYLSGLYTDPVAAFEGAWGHALADHLYVLTGQAAVMHLYRVAAGLDSLVIGETQIQGQVKRAWQEAYRQQLSGTLLNKIAQGALAAGKRVRHETGMGDKVVSVSSAAVELAEAALGLGGLSNRTALIIGAGETAELTLIHLRAAGISDVIVVNRTEARAKQLADKLGGRACAAEYLHEVLPEADVVIASSAAPHYILHQEHVRQALATRSQRPMFLIDISVPRILNPNIADVAGAHLLNLDDLTEVVSNNLQSRRAALPYAEAIIRDSASELSRWHLTRQAQRAKREYTQMLAIASD